MLHFIFSFLGVGLTGIIIGCNDFICLPKIKGKGIVVFSKYIERKCLSNIYDCSYWNSYVYFFLEKNKTTICEILNKHEIGTILKIYYDNVTNKCETDIKNIEAWPYIGIFFFSL